MRLVWGKLGEIFKFAKVYIYRNSVGGFFIRLRFPHQNLLVLPVKIDLSSFPFWKVIYFRSATPIKVLEVFPNRKGKPVVFVDEVRKIDYSLIKTRPSSDWVIDTESRVNFTIKHLSQIFIAKSNALFLRLEAKGKILKTILFNPNSFALIRNLELRLPIRKPFEIVLQGGGAFERFLFLINQLENKRFSFYLARDGCVFSAKFGRCFLPYSPYESVSFNIPDEDFEIVKWKSENFSKLVKNDFKFLLRNNKPVFSYRSKLDEIESIGGDEFIILTPIRFLGEVTEIFPYAKVSKDWFVISNINNSTQIYFKIKRREKTYENFQGFDSRTAILQAFTKRMVSLCSGFSQFEENT